MLQLFCNVINQNTKNILLYLLHGSPSISLYSNVRIKRAYYYCTIHSNVLLGIFDYVRLNTSGLNVGETTPQSFPNV